MGGSPALLALLRRNAKMNRRPRGPVPEGVEICVLPLRWGEPLDDSIGHVDWVLASDVTTLRASVSPLCETLAQLLGVLSSSFRPPAPRVVLSHQCRSDYDDQLEYFEAQAARRGLGVTVLAEDQLRDD